MFVTKYDFLGFYIGNIKMYKSPNISPISLMESNKPKHEHIFHLKKIKIV